MTDCVLGCPTYRVVLSSRCGNTNICDLENINELKYDRVMDDTSEAIVVLNLAGSGEDSCCNCIGNARSWIHAIMIFRDGDLVWGPGPVVNVIIRREQAVITARDVSAWLDVRNIHEDLEFYEENALTIAQALIVDAMLPDDPCDVAGQVVVYPATTPTLVDREYTSEDPTQYSGDALRELGRTVIDYTTIGQSILLGSPLSFGPYYTLTDEDFQVDLEVEERGLEAGTKWTVQSESVSERAGGIDPYYGLIEQILDESSIEDDDLAQAAAQNRLMASNPAPVYVNVPEGARLSPESKICFKWLVPGTLFNINVRSLCRRVYTQLRLTAVTVTVDDSGDESVGVTLSPLGTTAGEAN